MSKCSGMRRCERVRLCSGTGRTREGWCRAGSAKPPEHRSHSGAPHEHAHLKEIVLVLQAGSAEPVSVDTARACVSLASEPSRVANDCLRTHRMPSGSSLLTSMSSFAILFADMPGLGGIVAGCASCLLCFLSVRGGLGWAGSDGRRRERIRLARAPCMLARWLLITIQRFHRHRHAQHRMQAVQTGTAQSRSCSCSCPMPVHLVTRSPCSGGSGGGGCRTATRQQQRQ